MPTTAEEARRQNMDGLAQGFMKALISRTDCDLGEPELLVQQAFTLAEAFIAHREGIERKAREELELSEGKVERCHWCPHPGMKCVTCHGTGFVRKPAREMK